MSSLTFPWTSIWCVFKWLRYFAANFWSGS